MSVLSRLSKSFNLSNQDRERNFYQSFAFLSHELNNNLITIRAAAANLKNCIKPADIVLTNRIEKSLSAIEKKINHSMTLLSMTTIVTSPMSHWPSEIINISIDDCIRKTFDHFPFSSAKYASLINFKSHTSTLSVAGNQILLECVFYCLFNHAVRMLYHSEMAETVIELESDKIVFKYSGFTKLTNDKNDFFSLGTTRNYDNGFIFISNVLKNMHGVAQFEQTASDRLNVTLEFSNTIR